MSVILKAGLDGIKNKLQAPNPVDQNIYVMTAEERKEANIESLPSTLFDAVQNLKSSAVMQDALGTHLFERFVEAKEIEYDQFRLQVHPWEREQYIQMY